MAAPRYTCLLFEKTTLVILVSGTTKGQHRDSDITMGSACRISRNFRRKARQCPHYDTTLADNVFSFALPYQLQGVDTCAIDRQHAAVAARRRRSRPQQEQGLKSGRLRVYGATCGVRRRYLGNYWTAYVDENESVGIQRTNCHEKATRER